MTKQALDVVQAAEARALWSKAVRPVATQLGFKPGMTIMRGWVRDATPVQLTFWFQVTQFGFDKQTGGKFIVEFTAQNPGRHTSLRDRMWRLLDDQSRREVISHQQRGYRLAAWPIRIDSEWAAGILTRNLLEQLQADGRDFSSPYRCLVSLRDERRCPAMG